MNTLFCFDETSDPSILNDSKKQYEFNEDLVIPELPFNATGYDDSLSAGTDADIHFNPNKLKNKKFSKINKIFDSETILEWWSGYINYINYQDGYFGAILKDTKGNHLRAEFDFESALGIDEDPESKFFEGAKVMYSITKIHYDRGAPAIMNKIEVLAPPIWLEKDEQRIKFKTNDLFLEDLD